MNKMRQLGEGCTILLIKTYHVLTNSSQIKQNVIIILIHIKLSCQEFASSC